jgi:MYXO-CTERM domain-containing protein
MFLTVRRLASSAPHRVHTIMSLYRAIFSCFAFVVCTLYSPTASAIAAVFVSHETAHPGDSATVGVELTVHELMADFSLVVHYDPGVVSVNDVAAGSLLSVWGDEGLSWSDDDVSGELTLTGTAHGLAPVGWTSGPLLDITFDVKADAPFAVSPITLGPVTFSTPEGAEIWSAYESGSIRVTDPDAPPEPGPITATIEVSDMTVHAGDEVMVEISLTNDVPVVAVAFTLWVDSAVLIVGDEEGIELSERASEGTSARLPLADGAEQYAVGMTVEGPWLEPGEGWVMRLPYAVAEDAMPGLRPFGITSPDVIAMVEGVPTFIEVERVTGMLTIEAAADPDTGGAVPEGDTGLSEDTGPSEDTGETNEDTGEGGGSDDSGLGTGPGDVPDTEDTSPGKAYLGEEGRCSCSSGGAAGSVWVVVFAGLALIGRRRRRA